MTLIKEFSWKKFILAIKISSKTSTKLPPFKGGNDVSDTVPKKRRVTVFSLPESLFLGVRSAETAPSQKYFGGNSSFYQNCHPSKVVDFISGLKGFFSVIDLYKPFQELSMHTRVFFFPGSNPEIPGSNFWGGAPKISTRKM